MSERCREKYNKVRQAQGTAAGRTGVKVGGGGRSKGECPGLAGRAGGGHPT